MNGTQSKTETGSDHESGVAIIGIGCRLPGPAVDPETYWSMLMQKVSASGRVPANRFDIDKFLHSDKQRPGSMTTEGGYFLRDDPTLFEPQLFNIIPTEASRLDPAMKKLLEVVFETIESAGIPLEKLAGGNTGCYVGSFNHDELFSKVRDSLFADPYTGTTAIAPYLSNRLSYVFDLHGPSMTIDTACSASLYALHLAFQAIIHGEIEDAIVASSNLIWSPDMQLFLDKLGALSPTSQCHVFSQSADGYGRADGFVGFFLKDLKAAVRDGDPIHAVLLGTAVNANGRTGGITHPSPQAQEAAMCKAYLSAGNLDPADTAYYECHGTGTAVGDPLELRGVQSFFKQRRVSPLLLGSVKSNIGHGEPVSGLAGLLKTVLAIQHELIPPMRVPDQININLDLDLERFQLVADPTAWPSHLPVRASVASSGFGGANAHAIVQAYKKKTQVNCKDKKTEGIRGSGTKLLLVFSAHKPSSLQANFHALREKATDHDAQDVAYTLATRRSRLTYRGFSVAEQLHGSLTINKDLQIATNVGKRPPRIAFVLTGQGAQWPRMGHELFERFPVFRQTIENLTKTLQSLRDGPGWTLSEILLAPGGKSRVYEAEISQPACAALQIGLVDLLASWDLQPTACIGHSSGEMAAAYAAGMITADEAIVVAYYRGKAITHIAKKGAMLAITANQSGAQDHVDAAGPGICIAAVNSPESITLSGDVDAIQRLSSKLTAEKVFNRILATGDKAYHSHHMNEIGSLFETSVNSVYGEKKIKGTKRPLAKFYSTVLGYHSLDLKPTPSYWRKNLESPVLFSPALERIVADDVDLLVEIGPHSALAGPIRQLEAANRADGRQFPRYASTLVRNKSAEECMIGLGGLLYNLEANINIQAINQRFDSLSGEAIQPNAVTGLPTYRYEYGPSNHRFNRLDKEFRFPQFPFHELLGSRILGCSSLAPSWRNVIGARHCLDWPSFQHQDKRILPESSFIAMVLQAIEQVLNDSTGTRCIELSNAKFPEMLSLQDETDVVTSLFWRDGSRTKFSFNITSIKDEQTILHCTGDGFVDGTMTDPVDSKTLANHATPLSVEGTRWYQTLSDCGVVYNEASQIIQTTLTNPMKNMIRLDVQQQTVSNTKAPVEVALQIAMFTTAHYGEPRNIRPHRIESISKITCKVPISNTKLRHAFARRSTKDILTADVVMQSQSQDPFLSVHQVRFVPLELKNISKKNSMSLELMAKPDYTTLSVSDALQMFPTPAFPDPQLFSKVHKLATAMIVQYCSENADQNVQPGCEAGEHFSEWLISAMELVKQGKLPYSIELQALDNQQRMRLIQDTFDDTADDSVEACLMMRMYNNLAGILKGTSSAHDILLGDGMLAKLYASKFTAMGSMIQLRRVIDLVGHQDPGSKYLEIGGGTRGATREVLNVLGGCSGVRRYGEYCFTDVSSYFLSGAKEEFAIYPHITYKTLNIEQDPQTQDFQKGSFDVIIAANVLHATSSLKETLTNVHSLLKEGGTLILVETGGFQDYWKGRRDGRPSSPFISSSQWNEILQATGFSAPNINLSDYDDPYSTMNVIVCSAISSPATKSVYGTSNGSVNGSSVALTGSIQRRAETNVERYYPFEVKDMQLPLPTTSSNEATILLGDDLPTLGTEAVVLVDFYDESLVLSLAIWMVHTGASSVILVQSTKSSLRSTRSIMMKIAAQLQHIGIVAYVLPDTLGSTSPTDMVEQVECVASGIKAVIFSAAMEDVRQNPRLFIDPKPLTVLISAKDANLHRFAQAVFARILLPKRVSIFATTSDLHASSFDSVASIAGDWIQLGTSVSIIGHSMQEPSFDDLVPFFEREFLDKSEAPTTGPRIYVGPFSWNNIVKTDHGSNPLTKQNLPSLAILQQMKDDMEYNPDRSSEQDSTPRAKAQDKFRQCDETHTNERCIAATEVAAEVLAELLFIPRQQLRLDESLTKTGIDSLVASEFRTQVEAFFGKPVSTRLLLDVDTTLEHVGRVLVNG